MRRFNFINMKEREGMLVRLVNSGGFSNVSLYKFGEETYVIKELREEMSWNKEDNFERYAINEYKIGRMLNHKNIVKIMDMDVDNYALIMEYVEGYDMLDYQNEVMEVDYVMLLKNFYEILGAVEYMHELGVANRDLKLENIILGKDGVKLVDFGTAVEFRRDDKFIYSTERCGTPFYTPPEVYEGLKYRGDRVDVWSCGVMLYEILFGKVPWQCVDKIRDDDYFEALVYFRVGKLSPYMFNMKRYRIKELMTEESRKIIESIFLGIFKEDPVERMSIKEMRLLVGELVDELLEK